MRTARSGEFSWLGAWNELFDWQPCSLPLPLQGEVTGLGVRLASWVGALASDFFLYVPVELEVWAGDARQTLRGNALDYRQERS